MTIGTAWVDLLYPDLNILPCVPCAHYLCALAYYQLTYYAPRCTICQVSFFTMLLLFTWTVTTGMTLRCTTTVIIVNFKRLSNLIHHKPSRFTICLPSLHCTTIDNCKCKLLYFMFQPTAQSYSCSLTHLLLHATSNLEPAYDDNNTWLRISRSHYALRIGYTIPNANIHARWLA